MGGVFLENKKDKEAERINPYVLEFNGQGEVDFLCDRESRLGKMEFEGMKSMRELALRGKKYLIWLSPPGGESGYTEGRVVVGKVLETGGNVRIECRGVPLLRSRDEMEEMTLNWVKDGAVTMDEVRSVEDLRRESLGINLESEADLWDKCEEIFGVKEVWDYIRDGKDKVNKSKVEGLVNEAVAEIHQRGFGNEGMLLELMMRVRGYEIVGGNHGGTNLGMMGFGFDYGAFESLFNRSEMTLKTEIRGGRQVCPCGEILPEGSSRCPKCGLKLSRSDS